MLPFWSQVTSKILKRETLDLENEQLTTATTK